MFIAAYDDRYRLPDYITTFIRNTTNFCDLNFITPSTNLSTGGKLLSAPSRCRLNIIDPASLEYYQYARKLFDTAFVNYSTNSEAFERACFHRWFALNASTSNLVDTDYICLLDTDFLIGMNPDDVLAECISKANDNDLRFIAEWADSDPIIAIGPEITILTKSFLYSFCEYLLTTYFSPSMTSQLLKEYFERIGNGLAGGICDMRALAAHANLYCSGLFNLGSLSTPQVIHNFNSFLDSDTGRTASWKILFQQDKQTLEIDADSRKLIGTHFQGGAKAFIPLVCNDNGEDSFLSRSIIHKHMDSLASNARTPQALVRRVANKLRREILGRR